MIFMLLAYERIVVWCWGKFTLFTDKLVNPWLQIICHLCKIQILWYTIYNNNQSCSNSHLSWLSSSSKLKVLFQHGARISLEYLDIHSVWGRLSLTLTWSLSNNSLRSQQKVNLAHFQSILFLGTVTNPSVLNNIW